MYLNYSRSNMEELTDQDKKDILRRKNLGQEIDPPQSYENVPMCKCGSLEMTWNSDGTYECRKCNQIKDNKII